MNQPDFLATAFPWRPPHPPMPPLNCLQRIIVAFPKVEDAKNIKMAEALCCRKIPVTSFHSIAVAGKEDVCKYIS